MSKIHLLICKFAIVSSIALLASCDDGDGGSSNNTSNIVSSDSDSDSDSGSGSSSISIGSGSGSGGSVASISRFGSSIFNDIDSQFSTDSSLVWDSSTFL